MSDGLFGGLFDYNRDGELGAWERASEYAFYEEMTAEEDDFGFEEMD